MNPFGAFKLVVVSLAMDRVAILGAGGSSFAVWTGWQRVQEWAGLYATVVGALGATATLVYVCLKISRLLKNPEAKE